MMEAWLVDVGAVCRYIKYLAGQPDADLSAREQQQQQQHHGTWGSAGGATQAGHGSSVTPLVATSDASSHAPHLYAQLGLHRNCLYHMRGMKNELGLRMTATGGHAVMLAAKQNRLSRAFGLWAAVGKPTSKSSLQYKQWKSGGLPDV